MARSGQGEGRGEREGGIMISYDDQCVLLFQLINMRHPDCLSDLSSILSFHVANCNWLHTSVPPWVTLWLTDSVDLCSMHY